MKYRDSLMPANGRFSGEGYESYAAKQAAETLAMIRREKRVATEAESRAASEEAVAPASEVAFSRADGNCRGDLDEYPFVPRQESMVLRYGRKMEETDKAYKIRLRVANNICAGCELLKPCLEDAVDNRITGKPLAQKTAAQINRLIFLDSIQ